MKAAVSRLAMAWLERGQRKRFAGNLFERFEGLEPVLAQCRGASVLDIGACDGLVAYEFARRGASLVHGFELDPGDVAFARRLFRDVPAKSAFVASDLSVDGPRFREVHKDVLFTSYDVVLFLGVYHHLERQMERETLDAFVTLLASLAGSYFVVRTKQLDHVEPLVCAAGFRKTEESPGHGNVGPLRIYERSKA